MQAPRVGVLGATSFVGDSLLSQLQTSYEVVPFSRHGLSAKGSASIAVSDIPYWISLVPIWVLPDYFDLMAADGVQRIIALSSTSLLAKKNSRDRAEQKLAARLAESERRLLEWASKRNIEALILRSTLIYGGGRDRNVSEIARFIRRFGFFPIFGPAKGLRQPIHAEDVATACVRALQAGHLAGRCYNISGGETLPYCGMVVRIFEALGKRPRLISFPLWSFAVTMLFVRMIPRYRDWSVGMAERMNQDMVFDHSPAQRDLNLSLRAFQPELPIGPAS